MSNDEKYMMRAIELAKLGEGVTRPNPPVGAVLVLEDHIVAEGWHHKAGEAHAERHRTETPEKSEHDGPDYDRQTCVAANGE